jgi:hypothetical protein
MWLGAASFAVIVSIFKTPRFPVTDPALFEYFGRALLNGGTLYSGNLIDNKLPSIYLINVLWQALFGSNYFLHTCAEAVVNFVSIAIFALALRRAGVAAWALGTFLFALFFCLPFPIVDTVYHYAVFFTVLGVCLAFYGRGVFAGIAIAAATTFSFPAMLTCIPILMQFAGRRRLFFVTGFFGFGVAYALAMHAAFGPDVFASLAYQWLAYAQNFSTSGQGFRMERLHEVLTTGLGAAIPAMIALLLLVVRRPTSDVSRFALIWSTCALAGFFIPPLLLADRFLLPATPALAMAIASYNPTPMDVTRRPLLALVALALVALAAFNTVRQAEITNSNSRYLAALGEWIRSSYVSGATMYTFDYVPELPLAADSTRLVSNTSGAQRAWSTTPDILVAGPFPDPAAVQRNPELTIASGVNRIAYKLVCPQRAEPFAIYVAAPRAPAFNCEDEPRRE